MCDSSGGNEGCSDRTEKASAACVGRAEGGVLRGWGAVVQGTKDTAAEGMVVEREGRVR